MLEMLLTTLVPGLMPVVTDGVRGLISKFTGDAGAKPQNIKEVLQLKQMQLDQLTALAKIDAPTGKASLWVVNLRESARYISVYIILMVWVVCSFMQEAEQLHIVTQLAQSAFFFLFGDRVYLNLKKAGQHE